MRWNRAPRQPAWRRAGDRPPAGRRPARSGHVDAAAFARIGSPHDLDRHPPPRRAARRAGRRRPRPGSRHRSGHRQPGRRPPRGGTDAAARGRLPLAGGRPGRRSRGRPPRPSAADRRPGRFRLPPRGGQDPAGRARPQHDLPSLARRPRGRGAGSGYALLHADALPPQPGMVDAAVARLGDQCAGWALDWRLHRQPEGHRPPRHAPRTCGTAPRVARRRPPGLARHGATPARCHAPAPPARRTGARVRWPARHRRALSRQPRGRGGPRDRGPRVCRRRIDRRAPPPDRRPVGQGPRAAVGGMPGGRRQRRTVAGHDLR
jgi:hypothetical protein